MKRFTLFGSRLLFWLVAPWVAGGLPFFPYLAYQSFLSREPFGVIIALILWLACIFVFLKICLPEWLVWLSFPLGRMNIRISSSRYDMRIFESVKCGTSEKPHDLVQILGYVDALERVLLSYEELAGGLQRLTKQGLITESPRHKFYGATEGNGPRTFSGLSLAEYNQACEAYREWFASTLKKIQDDRKIASESKEF